jgi:hypothetical protein
MSDMTEAYLVFQVCFIFIDFMNIFIECVTNQIGSCSWLEAACDYLVYHLTHLLYGHIFEKSICHDEIELLK